MGADFLPQTIAKNYAKRHSTVKEYDMKKLPVLVAVFALLLSACGDGPKELPPGPVLPPTKKFWAWNENNVAYQLDAQMLASNASCEIWVEIGSGVTAAQAHAVANEYNTRIYPRMMNVFGWAIEGTDVMQIADINGDQNGKLIILLLDTGGAAGYFHPANFEFVSSAYNNSDMIYIDVAGTGEHAIGTTSFYETIAHEMQHLINFITGVFLWDILKIREVPEMDLWLNETLSEGAQYIYSEQFTNDHYRVRWYNIMPVHSTESYRNYTRIPQGNNFYVWGNHTGGGGDNWMRVLDDYSTAYLFSQWLRIHSQRSTPDNWHIYLSILLADAPDYRAVEDAAYFNNIYSGSASWAQILGDWLSANYINHASNLYGYKGAITLTPHYLPASGITHALYPGEGVYSSVPGTRQVDANSLGNIRYLGVVGNAAAPVPSGGDVTAGALLTYNIVTSLEKPTTSTGTVTGIASIQPPGSRVSSYRFNPDTMLRRVGRQPYHFSSGTDINIEASLGSSVSRGAILPEPAFVVDRSKITRVYVNE
jgi:hypothetical protein